MLLTTKSILLALGFLASLSSGDHQRQLNQHNNAAMGIGVGAGAVAGWAWVGIRDEGPGILKSDHHLVFQRAWGRDRSGLHRERRAGLGLSIVRQVAEAGGGTVTVTSVPGVGSSFVIWLPLVEGSDPSHLTVDGIHPVADPLFDLGG